MARPFPWLERLPNIRRSVSNSVRSHYNRRDLEMLFQVSPSAAGRLLKMVATESVGVAHLVGRERLSEFLESVSSAEDVPALCSQTRARLRRLTRIKGRYLCLRDEAPVAIATLPVSVKLEPGRLEVRFETVEQLVENLATLSQAMKDDPLAFEAACEVPRPEESAEAADARYLREEIARMDAVIAQKRVSEPAPGLSGRSS